MQLQKILEIVLNNTNSAFFYTPPIYTESKSYLFQNPSQKLISKNSKELIENINLSEDKIKNGENGFIIIPYEFGYEFEKKFNYEKQKEFSKIFLYKDTKIFDSSEIEIEPSLNNKYEIRNFALNITKEEYVNSTNKIKNYISEGDTYQVNFTIQGSFKFEGELISLFANLIFNQSAAYICLINVEDKIIISLSPELFFEIEGKNIKAKPMKGTIKRGVFYTDDIKQKNALALSEKNQAENLMIVDLIRNDLGRISKFGTVKVESLFEVEKYESLYQMTSTISAELKNNIKLSDVIQNLFPCGSITGAPKIRTMEIIKELEKEERGIYTGTIGLLLSTKKVFNVPIRTIQVCGSVGKIGLGSGIVWDSIPEKEFDETLLKADFLLKPNIYFKLFESILIENGKPFLLNYHIERLSSSADYFLFNFNKNNIYELIENIIQNLSFEKKFKIKLTLNKWGKIDFATEEIKNEFNNVIVNLSRISINSQNRFQYFKTTNRKFYDEQTKQNSINNFYETIFFNENGFLTEGCFTNIMMKKENVWFTPPIEDGILPGVYRKHLLISRNDIKEKHISLNELLEADEIVLINSVRKEVKVSKLYISENEYWEPQKITS